MDAHHGRNLRTPPGRHSSTVEGARRRLASPAAAGNAPSRWRRQRQRSRRVGISVGRPRRFRLVETSRPPARRHRHRTPASASTRTATRPRRRQVPGRPGRAGNASVTGPGQCSRIIRCSEGGRRRASRSAARTSAASSRKGPRRPLNRCSLRSASGRGRAAAPGTVPVTWARMPPRFRMPAARRRRRRARTGMRVVSRRSLRPGWRRPAPGGRPAASRAASPRGWPAPAPREGRRSCRR